MFKRDPSLEERTWEQFKKNMKLTDKELANNEYCEELRDTLLDKEH